MGMAGDAGREGLVDRIEPARLSGRAGSTAAVPELEDGLGSVRVAACFTSRIPPPLVTSCFSDVFLRQNDQRGRASSTAGVVSTGISGSPSLDLLVHESRELLA